MTVGGVSIHGITSACAEQTCVNSRHRHCWRDHLRVCRADTPSILLIDCRLGSPPRVRSRHGEFLPRPQATGITSACAEQTCGMTIIRSIVGDHLRVCGADSVIAIDAMVVPGSPPRVRSRQRAKHYSIVRGGITSACAEQTAISAVSLGAARDHLRVCGADPGLPATPLTRSGSPPRVRSRPAGDRSGNCPAGITSACAEQTSDIDQALLKAKDHLRVCGADLRRAGPVFAGQGSPPRVRSRRTATSSRRTIQRITSACAEQTASVDVTKNDTKDHLRVCGADFYAGHYRPFGRGSPPRVRSRH